MPCIVVISRDVARYEAHKPVHLVSFRVGCRFQRLDSIQAKSDWRNQGLKYIELLLYCKAWYHVSGAALHHIFLLKLLYLLRPKVI